ncbi:MAG: HIT domain-containing protein [Clostridiales bacterium]|nr:HIT domain-containing protein [Clostridiales bacterium]
MLKKALFHIAKRPFMGKVAGAAFRYFSWLIPVKKAYSSRKTLAFYHPQPCYQNHIVLSPRRAIRNLQQLASDRFNTYFPDLWMAVEEISRKYPEYSKAFSLVANGGRKQEVQQVHFHMFTDCEMVDVSCHSTETGNELFRNESIRILKCPDRESHYVILPVVSSEVHRQADFCVYLKSVLQSIDLLNSESGIVSGGYSLIYQHCSQSSENGFPVFHIVSEKKATEKRPRKQTAKMIF